MSVTLSALTDGQTRTIEQVASEGHMDPHYQSLATLAQRLADFGHSLQPGQQIITGAYGKTRLKWAASPVISAWASAERNWNLPVTEGSYSTA